jgi:hypothetical protein
MRCICYLHFLSNYMVSFLQTSYLLYSIFFFFYMSFLYFMYIKNNSFLIAESKSLLFFTLRLQCLYFSIYIIFSTIATVL